jgi:hypothetical protein
VVAIGDYDFADFGHNFDEVKKSDIKLNNIFVSELVRIFDYKSGSCFFTFFQFLELEDSKVLVTFH